MKNKNEISSRDELNERRLKSARCNGPDACFNEIMREISVIFRVQVGKSSFLLDIVPPSAFGRCNGKRVFSRRRLFNLNYQRNCASLYTFLCSVNGSHYVFIFGFRSEIQTLKGVSQNDVNRITRRSSRRQINTPIKQSLQSLTN